MLKRSDRADRTPRRAARLTAGRISGIAVFALAAVLGGAISGLGQNAGHDADLRSVIATFDLEPMPSAPRQDPALVALGRALFFDKELSGNRDIACATCHHPTLASGDGRSLSIGSGGIGLGADRQMSYAGAVIPRNAPDVFDRAHPDWRTMFWDGRVAIVDDAFDTPAGDALLPDIASLLAAQAMFPVTSPDEMRGRPGEIDVFGSVNELALIAPDDWRGMWDALMARVLAHESYVRLFAAAYPDTPQGELTFAHAANAIGAFESLAFTLTDSPWDRYLFGDDDALSEEAKEGALLFYGEAGCAACHSGVLMTDQEFHNIGVPQVGPGKGDGAPLDLGLALETGDPLDVFRFRTPPLRNVAVTGPWMHNGAFVDLAQAIRAHADPDTTWDEYSIESLEPELREMVLTDLLLRARLLDARDVQLEGMALTDAEISALVAFLESLTADSIAGLAALEPHTVPSGLNVSDTANPVAADLEAAMPVILLQADDTVSLADAILLAPPGAILRLAPGTYDGPVILDRPITIEALDGAAGVVVHSNGHGPVIDVRAPDVVVRGLAVSGGTIGIAVNDAVGVRIEGNDLHGNRDIGIAIADSAVVVRGNRLAGIGGPEDAAIRISGRDGGFGTLIEGNLIAASAGTGVLVEDAFAIVRGNDIRDNGHAGVQAQLGSSLIASDNDIQGNVGNGIAVLDQSTATLTGNRLFLNGRAAETPAVLVAMGCEALLRDNVLVHANGCALITVEDGFVNGVGNRMLDGQPDGACSAVEVPISALLMSSG